MAAIHAEEPDAVDIWLRDPSAAPHGGESICELIGRVASWLDRQDGRGGKIVAVTHSSVIKAAVIHAIDAMPRSFFHIDMGPLSIVDLGGVGGRWTLKSIGRLDRVGRT